MYIDAVIFLKMVKALEESRIYIKNVSIDTLGTASDHADYDLLEEIETVLKDARVNK